MARTRTTLRVKQPPMIPTEIDTPESVAAASTAVTESTYDPASAEAFDYTEQNSDNKSEEDEEDTSVKLDTKKSAKRRLTLQDSDDDDDAFMEEISDDQPVILELEEEKEEEADDEEVVCLGTVKPPKVSLANLGNSHRNVSMTYCVGNVNFGKAYGQFMMMSNGFDQNGSPRHTFRNYLLEVFVTNGKYYVTPFSLFHLTRTKNCTAGILYLIGYVHICTFPSM